MKHLIVAHHLGLGDVLTISPAIRYFCESNENVYVFSKSNYFENTMKLYHDVDNLTIIEIENDTKEYLELFSNQFPEEHEYISCGVYGKTPEMRNLRGKNLPDIFYEQLNVPLEVYNTHFKISNDVIDNTAYELVKDYDYIFVNAKSSETNHIEKIKKELPTDKLILNQAYNHYEEGHEYYELAQKVIGLPLWDYTNIIRGAKEIYTIGHLFSCISKFVANKDSKKVIFNYNNLSISEKFFSDWEVI